MIAMLIAPMGQLVALGTLCVFACVACSDGDTPSETWEPWANAVVAFTPGPEAGFGEADMPHVALGPPKGGNPNVGSLDVVSLGNGGEIILAFDGPIVDGPGPDFLVFENAFQVAGRDGEAYVEPARVAVSRDGVTWHEFPCVAQETGHWQGCAGLTPQATPAHEWTAPFDPALTGGDAFDLAAVGLPEADYVRITDLDLGGDAPSAGFDLDAVAIVHNPASG